MLKIDNNQELISEIDDIDKIIKKEQIKEIYNKKYNIKNKQLINEICELHQERDQLLKKANNNINAILYIIALILGIAIGYVIWGL